MSMYPICRNHTDVLDLKCEPSIGYQLVNNKYKVIFCGLLAQITSPPVIIYSVIILFDSFTIITANYPTPEDKQRVLNNLASIQALQIVNGVGLLTTYSRQESTPLLKISIVATIFTFIIAEGCKACVLSRAKSDAAIENLKASLDPSAR